MKDGEAQGSVLADHVERVDNNTNDPLVQRIRGELTALCRKYTPEGCTDRAVACAVLSALLCTAVSACKSYGIHPRDFIANFEKIYEDTPAPRVIPVLKGRSS